MAITLSSAKSTTLEPKLKHRFLLRFDTVPGSTNTEDFTFSCKSAKRPDVTFNDVEVHRLNEKFKFAGKPEWGKMSTSYYDYINGTNSISDVLWRWGTKIYNPANGMMGFASEYKTNGTLVLIDPHGEIVQTWALFGTFPSNLDYQDVDVTDDSPLEIASELSFDYAVKGVEKETRPGITQAGSAT